MRRSAPEQAVPHMVAALAAYGARALGPAQPAGAGPAALLGCHLLREVLGTAGAPDWLAVVIADPDDEDALAALDGAVDDALADHPGVQARVVERLTAFHQREFAAGTAHALTELGGLLWWLDDLDGAQAAYQRAAAAGDLQALLDLALLLAERGDDDGTAALVRQAADAGNPDLAGEALVKLGSLLSWRRRDPGLAREAYQRAIDGGHPHWGYAATMGLAHLMERHGDSEGALAAYRQAVATAPAECSAEASVTLGAALEQRGDLAGAAAAYGAVIGSDAAPWAGDALVSLANLLQRQGDLDGVRAARATALAAGNPEAPHALVAIGRLLAERGDAEGARAAYREAIDEGLRWGDDLEEELSAPSEAEPTRDLAVEGAGQVPPQFDVRNLEATGAGVLEHGLPALPDPLSYHLVIPVASWTAASCAVVLFVRFLQDGERITPLAVLAEFARDGDRWTAHEHATAIGFSHDPVARPDDARRGFGDNVMTVSGGRTARAPAAGHPAVILTGSARPEVRELALTQGGREDRRPLESHFGAWVVCVEEGTPFEVSSLDENGVVLARIEEAGRPG